MRLSDVENRLNESIESGLGDSRVPPKESHPFLSIFEYHRQLGMSWRFEIVATAATRNSEECPHARTARGFREPAYRDHQIGCESDERRDVEEMSADEERWRVFPRDTSFAPVSGVEKIIPKDRRCSIKDREDIFPQKF
jgi:hypothetical protein